MLVVAPFIEHEAKIVECRPFQFFVANIGSDLDCLLQMPDCGRVISHLPVDQAQLILCVSDFAAIAEFLFHAQGLLSEFQSFVQIFQFAVAIRDITQGDRFTMAVVT